MSKNQITFTKEQREAAIKNGLPLCAISFDDRHLPKSKERKGKASFVGPLKAQAGAALWDFMMKMIRNDL